VGIVVFFRGFIYFGTFRGLIWAKNSIEEENFLFEGFFELLRVNYLVASFKYELKSN